MPPSNRHGFNDLEGENGVQNAGIDLGGAGNIVQCLFVHGNVQGIKDGGTGSLIGGPNAGDGVVVSQNELFGLAIIQTDETTIQGSFVGTTSDGLSDAPN